MTGLPIPVAPAEYQQQAIQQAFQAIDARLNDIEELQNRIWKVTTKKIDQTITGDDSLNDDNELFFTVEPYKTYRFRFMVFFDSAAAADFKFTINGPGSPTLVRMLNVSLSPDDAAFTDMDVQTAFNFGPVAITHAAGTAGWFWVEGILQNGANAGGVYLQWAQNTSNGGNTTVLGGSYVQYGQA